ncbi:hypothetical protein Catovirus_1_670 [Catovirus CTV1]|uniref:t-SNARE coiled-coil homology domain-containing protein n=1 Tax=Catovirus CTV1 TaxID=1977631 RepID=A0A1V0SA76_9VIRU|nr:hypothetical protein Catovirus_1_670 [Catovirus CTV1]
MARNTCTVLFEYIKIIYVSYIMNLNIENTLNKISLITDKILDKAVETNLLLSEQNNKLEQIELKVDNTNNNISVANSDINKLISETKLSFINGLSTGATAGGVIIGTIGILGFGSLPVLGTSIAFTCAIITGTFLINKFY